MSIARYLSDLIFFRKKVVPDQTTVTALQTKFQFTHERDGAPNVTKLTDDTSKMAIKDVWGDYPDEISGREWCRAVSVETPEGVFSRVERDQGYVTRVTATGKFKDEDKSTDFDMDITSLAYAIGSCRETLFARLKPKLGDKTDLVVASLCSNYPYELIESVKKHAGVK